MSVKQYRGADDLFLRACKAAGVPATARQHRKWRRKFGSAWKARGSAEQQPVKG